MNGAFIGESLNSTAVQPKAKIILTPRKRTFFLCFALAKATQKASYFKWMVLNRTVEETHSN
jgi:hypothetical protein